MIELLKNPAPVYEKTRSEALKDFTETLLKNAEKIDLSAIDEEHQPITGAISAMEMIIQDSLCRGLALMCPGRYVWAWNGRWFKLDPTESHKFFGEYLKLCGVPKVDRALVKKTIKYLHQISENMDVTLGTFQRKIAPIAMRSQIKTLKS